MKNIVNIINFVRGVEPREGRNIDLPLAVKQQIRLLKEHELRGTFLLQYDALIEDEYIRLMQSCKEICEIGLWFEIVQPLVEAVGEKWTGRYSWDWYNDVGFLIGYEPEIRKKLIDEAMHKFEEVFGYYPKSVGCWHIDAVSMAYLSEKYQVRACCICRDQVGLDGYTMQGGYYNQAYYPSKNNMFCPANSKENQINMPVFRMLGSDAIYAYDVQIAKLGLEKTPTLEAIGYGGTQEWCDWFFDETFSGNGLSMQYTQAGQENSFGWPRMSEGLEYQFPLIKKLEREGKLEIMTLSESGDWYASEYELTSPATLTAMRDWKHGRFKSVWYYSRFYRVNLFWDDGVVRLRDMYLFDDSYEEHYLHKRCDTHACEFRNLPVMDGVLYSDSQAGQMAGIYLTDEGEPVKWKDIRYIEKDKKVEIHLTNEQYKALITLDEMTIKIESDIPALQMTPVYDRNRVYGKNHDQDSKFANHNNSKTMLTYVSRVEKSVKYLQFTFEDTTYRCIAEKGNFDGVTLCAENGEVIVRVSTGN